MNHVTEFEGCFAAVRLIPPSVSVLFPRVLQVQRELWPSPDEQEGAAAGTPGGSPADGTVPVCPAESPLAIPTSHGAALAHPLPTRASPGPATGVGASSQPRDGAAEAEQGAKGQAAGGSTGAGEGGRGRPVEGEEEREAALVRRKSLQRRLAAPQPSPQPSPQDAHVADRPPSLCKPLGETEQGLVRTGAHTKGGSDILSPASASAA